jgi:hypothetical protein
MLSTVYFATGMSVSLLAYGKGTLLAFHADRKLRSRAHPWMALGAGSQLILDVIDNTSTSHVTGYFNAAMLAWSLWQWWNSGGGDGIRKLWKKTKAQLTLRTSAPQPS